MPEPVGKCTLRAKDLDGRAIELITVRTLMLNRSAGTSLVRSVGVVRSCHKLDSDVTPPAKRQLEPTTATGSETGFLYGILAVRWMPG